MIGNKTGNLGENIALRFLEGKGFTVFTCNYHKKWGEIDLVLKKGDKFHFVEVKAVSRESLDALDNVAIRPEENIHFSKIDKLKRVIESFIVEFHVKEWQFDVCVVYMDITNKQAKVKYLENIVFSD